MAKWFELPDLPIRITARGEWLHGDEPLHPRVATLFSRNIAPEPDGSYFIQLGYARQKIDVDDTAYFVRSMRARTEGEALNSVTLHLSDGSEEALDPSTLMQSDDNVFYCAIKRRDVTVPCRFAPGQYHELALHAEIDGDDAYMLMAGKRWPIRSYQPAARHRAPTTA